MEQFNVMDIYSIQECLVAYKKILDWLPVTNFADEVMKNDRITSVLFLIDKCEDILKKEKEENE